MNLKNELIKIFGESDAEIRFFAAPGRVNLIGEHIDYCGGFVFPAALSLDCKVAVRKNGSRRVNMAVSSLPGTYSFDLDDIDAARNLKWGNYQAGVTKELINKGLDIGGFDMYMHGNVPYGSGLSSSAAIELVTGFALNSLFGGKFTNIELALIGQEAEHTFCEVNCGIMDQFASAMGKKNNAILLNCATLEYKYFPLELGDNVIVLANTCKKHALGASKYNERRHEVDVGLKLFQKYLKKENLCDYTPKDLEDYIYIFKDFTILQRVTHVIYENERVREATAALSAGNLNEFGVLLRMANQSIRYLYEATGEELDAIYDAAVEFDGCIGARMTGGGFGGCTINIVAKDKVEEFKEFVSQRYLEETGNVAEFYVCETGDGAREISEAEANI